MATLQRSVQLLFVGEGAKATGQQSVATCASVTHSHTNDDKRQTKHNQIAEDKHLGTRIVQLQRLRRDAPGTSHS